MTATSLQGAQDHSDRRAARIFGWLMLLTFATSIPALLLLDPVLNDADYILGGGGWDSQIAFAAWLEIILVIANVGTAVVLFPIARRYSETLALSWVASRIIEGVAIMIGVIAVLATLTLRDDLAGTDGESLFIVGDALVAIKDWSFVMGPNFCVAVGNGMILGWLMYRSGLVPKKLAILGLIGGPALFVAATLAVFDVWEPTDSAYSVLVIPEFFWELLLGIYLIVKGFRPEALAALYVRRA